MYPRDLPARRVQSRRSSSTGAVREEWESERDCQRVRANRPDVWVDSALERRWRSSSGSSWLPLAPPALAHAALERADPAPRSSLAAAPEAVTLWFTEPVVARYSRIAVLDASGVSVASGDLAGLPDSDECGAAAAAPGGICRPGRTPSSGRSTPASMPIFPTESSASLSERQFCRRRSRKRRSR